MIDRPTLYLRISPWNCFPAEIKADYIGKPVFLYDKLEDKPEILETLQNWKCAVYSGNCFTRKQRAELLRGIPPYTEIVADIVWHQDIFRYLTEEPILKKLSRFQMPYYDEGIHDIRISNTFSDHSENAAFCEKCWSSMEIQHMNSHHRFTVATHCRKSAEYLAERNDLGDARNSMLIAAMYHDVGKPWTQTFTDNKGNPTEEAHYYNHQNISAWIACGISHTNPLIPWLISTHMDPTLNTKYYRSLPPYLKHLVDALHEADRKAH